MSTLARSPPFTLSPMARMDSGARGMRPEFRFGGFETPHYTQVPDALFDELLPRLSGAELKVLLYVIRRTLGFKKRADRISLGQMQHGIARATGDPADIGTGLSSRAVRCAVKSLVGMGVIEERQHQGQHGYEAKEYSLALKPEVEKSTPPPWVQSTPPLGTFEHPPLGTFCHLQDTEEIKKQNTSSVEPEFSGSPVEVVSGASKSGPQKDGRRRVKPEPVQWDPADLWLPTFLRDQATFTGDFGDRLNDAGWWLALSDEVNGVTRPFLVAEFASMERWIRQNPARAPTLAGVRRFVGGWIKRAAEQRRRQASGQTSGYRAGA